jgi:23S rRNA (uracil1939-C5)-methyltransferase
METTPPPLDQDPDARPDRNAPFSCRIEKLVFGGWGLAHHAGKTVFVNNVAAGETVTARIYKKAKGVRYAEMVGVESPNAIARRAVSCQHAGICGGCSYQHLTTEAQIQAKAAILREIYGPSVEILRPILSPDEFHYRNKMEFGFTRPPDGAITYGLHPRGRFRHILDLQECRLVPAALWQAGQMVKAWIQKNDSAGTTGQDGFWQHLTLRQAQQGKQLLLILEVADIADTRTKLLAEHAMTHIPGIIGVGAKLRHQAPIWLAGQHYLEEIVGEVRLRYNAENFFQVNIAILPHLMSRIAEIIQSHPPAMVWDLFSGTGLFGITLGKLLGGSIPVIAAEADATAAKIANDNAAQNGLVNYQSWAEDLYQSGWGQRLLTRLGKPADNALAIIDPPRAGLTNKTVAELVVLNPKRIVYVSCNPTTQKRDIDWLLKIGYRLGGVQMIDMFPQTYHLESLAWLER